MWDIVKKSTLAGILIGFGVIINTKMEIPLFGSLLFSFGLLTIINMKLYLFTGKIGYIITKERMKPLLLLLVLFYNFMGITIAVGTYILANPTFVNMIAIVAINKFSKSFLTLFLNACFCGALIHFAVKNKNMILTIFAIMIFILIGAEHCIADFPYLLCNISRINILKLLSIIIGNSIGAIIVEGLSD